MNGWLQGRHVVVTGGGGGLGAAIASVLAAEGADLTLMGRTPATLEKQVRVLRRSSTGRAGMVVCDVADPESVRRAFAQAVVEVGPIHVLINNAGVAGASAFAETTLALWQQLIAVNLTGTFLCTQQVLPAMLAASSGRIISIASTAGLNGYARVAAYCAAKHGVVGLTRALAAETARTGVTVNVVCPGYIEGSAMLKSAISNVSRVTGKSADGARAILAKQSPTGTFVSLQDVAAKVLWLCSEDAARTTGQAIVIDGGKAALMIPTPEHFGWHVDGRVATITLNRPERKNPLTFESYGELIDTFRALVNEKDIRAVVLTGAGGNFCSGGDVEEIIGPLVTMQAHGNRAGLLKFTTMTGDLVKSMRACPQPIVAAIDGICAGAGAILAMASDLRIGTARSRVGFLFVRVGLSGADMGACALLPRIIGQGRASELLYTGRFMDGVEAERWGFYNALAEPDAVLAAASTIARTLATGPTFAHAITKRSLHEEWDMSVDDAIAAEARAQAICMDTQDFVRGYRAFLEKRPPKFEGD